MKIKKIFIILLIILTFSMITVCADEIESEINNQTEEQETVLGVVPEKKSFQLLILYVFYKYYHFHLNNDLQILPF